MYIYRLKMALVAISRNEENGVKLVTLGTGTVVRTPKSGPKLPQSGLVDVIADGKQFSMFIQDLQDRAERIDVASGAD